MAPTGHIHLLFERSIGSPFFATEEEKLSSRKRVLEDLDIVCWR